MICIYLSHCQIWISVHKTFKRVMGLFTFFPLFSINLWIKKRFENLCTAMASVPTIPILFILDISIPTCSFQRHSKWLRGCECEGPVMCLPSQLTENQTKVDVEWCGEAHSYMKKWSFRNPHWRLLRTSKFITNTLNSFWKHIGS